MISSEKMGIMHIFMLIFILMLGIYFIIIASMGCVKDNPIYFIIGILVFLFMPVYLFFVVGTSINEENQIYGMIITMIMLISCIFFIVMAAKGCVANKAAFYGIGIVWMLISAGGLYILYQKNNLLIASKLTDMANDILSSATTSAQQFQQQMQQPLQQMQQMQPMQQMQQPMQQMQQMQQPLQQMQQPLEQMQQQVGGETFIPQYKVATWL
jgi:hypothetical protein